MAAVVFCRNIASDGQVSIQFVCAKTKVAPLKRLTIPRLELTGAVLLIKLTARVITSLQREDIKVYLWTDSTITLTWVTGHPAQWRDFVHNRVVFIQDTLPMASWRFVPGLENPADLATRGVTPSQLSELSTWWHGPIWLTKPSQYWPSTPCEKQHETQLEERSVGVSTNMVQSTQNWNLIDRYSSLDKLIRITAVCQRAARCFKRSPDSSLRNPISPVELKQAKEFWTKEVQRYNFSREFSRRVLSSGKSLPKTSSLVRLTPFIDSKGILRVGGRLGLSNLTYEAKHPAILPKKSTLTTLVISWAHLRSLHGGTQLTSSFIREEFWIIGGRSTVRSHIYNCVTCARFRRTRAQQLMGQLPSERVIPSRPFLNTGVDYAGPFLIKTWKGRNARTYKGYVALFVCFSTSAIHLELVTDYTTEAFLAAYKRFSSRRGFCATLISDCGSNLKGAEAELQRLFSAATEESHRLATLLARDGTQWKFNPPSAPHFGGKWEAGVKSMKYHLTRVIGENLLTFEEMTTLLAQVEAVLNSRPLCPMTDDPEDLTAITPGHFIMGCAPTVIPEPSLEDEKTTRLSRWQLLRKMLDSLWSKWSTEYLQRFHSTYKWNEVTTPIKQGSMVLIVDERYPPAKWPLGRVVQVHPGQDGLIRVVTVKTKMSEYKRPITKLCLLPINTDTTDSFIN